jgi:hypothetical protein
MAQEAIVEPDEKLLDQMPVKHGEACTITVTPTRIFIVISLRPV